MGSLSSRLLADATTLIEEVHGEPIRVLSGSDSGKTFIGVVEHESDLVLSSDLGADPRGKVMARFRNAPNIESQEKVQTSDGKKWIAVRQDFSSFLTTDFELKEFIGKDS